MAKKNNNVEEPKQIQTEGKTTIETYTKEIEKLEASKLDASSNYKKAEEILLKIVKDEQVSSEEKAKLLDKAYKQLLLTDEQRLMLNDVYIAEYSKTKQFKDKQIEIIMESMADDDGTITPIIPSMDYTKEYGLSYMALKKDKSGKFEQYFVSSKKEICEYKDCEKVGIYLKHQNNSSAFSMRAYMRFYNGEDNITAGNVFKTLKQQLQKYIIFPYTELYDIISLWIMHTYIYCIFRYVPYIWLNAEAGSGKSNVIDIVMSFSFNGDTNVGGTPAIVYRTIDNNGSTLFLDEFEDMTGEEKGLILAILKAGFKNGATVKRCSSDNYKPESFSAFSPKVFAGITDIDDVLLSRCIKISMQRAKDVSSLTEFISNDPDFKAECSKIKNDLHIFGLKYVDEIINLYKDKELFALEKGYTPREKDLWKPLLAISKIVDKEENITTENSIISYSKILHEELMKAKFSELKPRLLLFLTEYIQDRNDLIYQNWYRIDELYWDLKDTGDFPEIKSNESVGKYMSGFGFEKEVKRIPSSTITVRDKKKTGYIITKEKLEEVKKKFGFDML